MNSRIHVTRIEPRVTIHCRAEGARIDRVAIPGRARIDRIGIPGPPGPGVSDGGVPLPTLPSAIALSALRIVSSNGTNYNYSNPADSNSVWSIAGLTTSATSQGQSCTPVRNQPIADGAWSWDTSMPVFLGAAGVLTQSPPASNYLVVVARALNPQTLFIQIEEPIQL